MRNPKKKQVGKHPKQTSESIIRKPRMVLLEDIVFFVSPGLLALLKFFPWVFKCKGGRRPRTAWV